MAFRIEFAAEAERDLALIFDHLNDSYAGFGEPANEAFRRAEQRIRAIRRDADTLRAAPFRGTRHDDLLLGLRHVTIGGAVWWFTVDEPGGMIRIIAVFFGGQDHIRRMMLRLLDRPEE